MNGLSYVGEQPDNSIAKVAFRERIMGLQNAMCEKVSEGARDALEDCPLVHRFTPISEQFGCSVYAREMTIPAGVMIVGKIHRHSHINIISKGTIAVSTEFGQKMFHSPYTFISEPGTKRAVLAVTETVWTTIHLVDNPGEENVDDIVDSLTYASYEDAGLVSDTNLLEEKKP